MEQYAVQICHKLKLMFGVVCVNHVLENCW